MTRTVERIGKPQLGQVSGLQTLEQRFRFAGTSADAIAKLLLDAPLVGDRSIFGNRPGQELQGDGDGRRLSGFSPAPGFRFDVHMRQVEPNVFVVGFAQPDRQVPYLKGEIVWFVTDEDDAVVFDEQVNTARAHKHASEPLGGPKPSLRRWLFFRVGHHQVMDNVVKNLALLP